MKNIHWGIIGCGDVTEVKSGPAFQKAKNSILTAVMRRNGDLAKDYAQRHNVPKWYDNADELINDKDIDAIYVATPPANHLEYTLKCASVCKPVYVEKPMALNYQECTMMIDACKNAGVPLFVAYYKRTLPKFLKVREILSKREIGDIRFISITHYRKPEPIHFDKKSLPWRVNPSVSGGGLFVDLASHTFDIFDYLLGPISKVQGIASNQAGLYNAEDLVSANFNFSSGVQGTGTWCFTAFDNYEMNEIMGSKGKVRFSTFGSEPLQVIAQSKTTEYAHQNPSHIQQPLIQTIVNSLNGTGACESTGISGARTSRVMDAILKEYYMDKL